MQGRPILDSEINLIQSIQNERFSKFSTSLLHSGWTNTEPRGLDSASPVAAVFSAFEYLFNGQIVRIDDGDGRCTVNMGVPIQQIAREDYILTIFYREEVAAAGEGTRLREQVKLYGNLNGSNLLSDLMDPALPSALATTHRVQFSYRNVSCSVADFLSVPAVDTLGRVAEDYTFNYYDAVQGYYRAGDGSARAAEVLGTADGYVYMVPIFSVTRSKDDQIIFGDSLKSLARRFSLRIGIAAKDVGVTPIPEIGLEANLMQAALEDIYAAHNALVDHLDGFYAGLLTRLTLIEEGLKVCSENADMSSAPVTPPPSSGGTGGSTPPAGDSNPDVVPPASS
jgi:hypothetical protein